MGSHQFFVELGRTFGFLVRVDFEPWEQLIKFKVWKCSLSESVPPSPRRKAIKIGFGDL